MSFNKAIQHGKEHRKQYRGMWDNSCLNHGGCPGCMSSRMRKVWKVSDSMDEQLREYKKQDKENEEK